MRMMAIEEKAGETIQSVLWSNGFPWQFCDMVLNSLEQLEQHRIGTKHQRKVAAATGNLIKKEEQASKSSSLDVWKRCAPTSCQKSTFKERLQKYAYQLFEVQG